MVVSIGIVFVLYLVALVYAWRYKPPVPVSRRADFARLAPTAQRAAEGFLRMEPAIKQVGVAMHNAGRGIQKGEA
jgi:hypothetical protein